MSVELQTPLEPASPTRTVQTTSTTHNCPACGTTVTVGMESTEEAQRVIRDLQAQMQLLEQQAAAAGKFAEPRTPAMLKAYLSISKKMRRLRRSDSHYESCVEHQPKASAFQHIRPDRYLLSRRPSIDSDLVTWANTIPILVSNRQTGIACELDNGTAAADTSIKASRP
jgi:hypothetical protein